MTRPAYYNEFDEYAAQWLRNLIACGHLPAGDVDTRSIVDVQPDDLAGYGQCHFFAGIGGWALAARLAGWPDERELWTGSCPCQPFSVAGKGKAQADDRHLWPHLFRLVRARRPAVLMGEQVAAAVGKDWLDGVFTDLEGIGYACGAAVVPACAVDAPHRRDRLWFVAARGRAVGHGVGARLEGLAGDGNDPRGWAQSDRSAVATGRGSTVADPDVAGTSEGWEQRSGQLGRVGSDPRACDSGDVATASRGRCGEPGSREVQQPGRAKAVGGSEAGDVADAGGERRQQVTGSAHGDEGQDERRTAQLHYVAAGHGQGRWGNHVWIIGHDGKARRVEPGIRLLAHGVSARVGRLRAYGNAIVPEVAVEVIGAFMDAETAIIPVPLTGAV